MHATDPDTVITRHFIESLIHSGQLTALKYGDAWLVNLDELYLLLSAEKPDDMVKHNLSYKETVIKFWGIESRKKIRARITLLMNWEAAYKSGGKRALIEQHSPKKHN